MIRTTNCSKITHPNDVLSHSVSDSYSIDVDIVTFRYKAYNEDMRIPTFWSYRSPSMYLRDEGVQTRKGLLINEGRHYHNII